MQWSCDAMYMQNKRKKVKKVLKERYLRNDLSCKSELCEECPEMSILHSSDFHAVEYNTLSESFSKRYLIPDVDVLLQQMDIWEYKDCNELDYVIILETVWESLRKKDLSIYNRLYHLLRSDRSFIVFANEHHADSNVVREKGESLMDVHTRAIYRAAQWYSQHLGDKVDIVVITNGDIHEKLARDMEIQVENIAEFIKPLVEKNPRLHDLLATMDDGSASKDIENSIYRKHLEEKEMEIGVASKRLFKGTIRCDRDHWLQCHVLVTGSELSNERVPVMIKGREHINRAIDGDVVVIEILPKAEWESPSSKFNTQTEDNEDNEDRPKVENPTLSSGETELAKNSAASVRPTGRVVGILKRNWRKYCGSLQVNDGIASGTTSLFIAVNTKVPKIRIRTRQREELMDKRILVAIDSWPADSHYPLGHYVSTIGTIGDKDTETKVLLMEHDIPTGEFTEKVMACLPPADWKITDENSIGRTDLRHLPVMSIDPPGCKDIDDALHVRELENGNLEIGVHIADVTHFVEPSSALDEEAADRGTSTYLVERRLDMLPGLLTTELCSLTSNTDHFAFSVLWEITPPNVKESTGVDVVNVSFCKSIIHSVAALSYGQAQKLLDEKKENKLKSPKAWSVKQMHKIATILRKRRIDAGALTLASPEVRFVLDTETQNPLDVQMYSLKDTNALVEEFMLLANITVSKKILRHFPTFSLLRRHPAPSKKQFEELIKSAAAVGVTISVDSSKDLANSLDSARRYDDIKSLKKGGKTEDSLFNKMIRILTTRCMMPAAYFCSGEVAQSEFHHYGLAAPIYTHFTSPIRRYADVVVHRLLSAAIGVSPLPSYLESKTMLHDMAENLNRRHLSAQLAGRASVSLHTLLYFYDNPVETSAVVVKVRSNGIRVMLPRYGIEGMIFLCHKGEESTLVFDEKKQSISPVNNPKAKITFLDKVETRVSVKVSIGNRRELDISLLAPSAFILLPKANDKKKTKKRKLNNAST